MEELKDPSSLSEALGIHPGIAQVLIARGISRIEEARAFLYPELESGLRPPELLPDIEPAMTRIMGAIEQGRPILLWGHDDLDGALGIRLLFDTLRAMGGEVHIHIPDRYSPSHGLNQPGLEAAAKRGVGLVITVDCGATNHFQAELARRLGLGLVITDHHQPIRGLPRADAVVMPTRLDRPHPFQGLSGAGVAHKLALALRRGLGCEVADNPDELALVALSIIADRMPIIDENRVLVKFGLEALLTSTRPGLRALRGALPDPVISPSRAAELLIPLLSGNPGSELVRFFDPDLAAEECLRMLESFRKRAQEFDELARAQSSRIESGLVVDPNLVAVADPKLQVQCIGYWTARLRSRFRRPALVLAPLDEANYPTEPTPTERLWHGELRSPREFDLLKLLKAVEGELEGYGGHPTACGFTVKAPKVERLIERLRAEAAGLKTITPPPEGVEASLPLSELGPDLLLLAPFGEGNRPPRLASPQTQLRRLPDRLVVPDNPEVRFAPNPVSDSLKDGTYDLTYTVDDELRVHILTATAS